MLLVKYKGNLYIWADHEIRYKVNRRYEIIMRLSDTPKSLKNRRCGDDINLLISQYNDMIKKLNVQIESKMEVLSYLKAIQKEYGGRKRWQRN